MTNLLTFGRFHEDVCVDIIERGPAGSPADAVKRLKHLRLDLDVQACQDMVVR